MNVRAITFSLVMLVSSSAWSQAKECRLLFTTSTSQLQIFQNAENRANEALDSQDLDTTENPNLFSKADLKVAQDAAYQEFAKTGDLKLAVLLVQYKSRLTQLQSYKLFAKLKEQSLRAFARGVYRPVLMHGREFMKEFGAFWRAYVIRRSMDLAWTRWTWVENLHAKGKDEASYGGVATKGLVTVLSKIASPSAKQIADFRSSKRSVGRSLQMPDGRTIEIKPYEMSPMIGLSGMSYPQLSANAVLSLLYIHIKLAKEGVRYTYNTGEGGPSFHLALLDPKITKAGLTDAVTRYAIDAGIAQPYSLKQVEVERAVERILEDRDMLFKDFTQEDLNRAQIIGQLGPALNGARTKDNRLDLKVLAEWAKQPYYAGTQFKLKQAAKKGAKVNASKVGAVTAYLRKIMPGKAVEAPDLSVEWADSESLATAIIATKLVTKKPVSLKFAVGQAQEVYDMLEFLRDQKALPDHIQLDGSGYVRLPGSGNAPVMDNTSLNITTATMTVDAILKKLGIRDEIYLEATGDIITPPEALMNMSLGADGVAAARLWMGMGLGCALVQKCATGHCYYGIASGDGTLFSEGLDPKVIGPKGAKAAQYWFESYSRLQLEAGSSGAVPFRKEMGLDNPYNTVRIRGEYQLHALEDIFSVKEVARALQGRITLQETEGFIFGDRPKHEPQSEEASAINALTNETFED
jgi:glutamate synthase domain-containing protein 2